MSQQSTISGPKNCRKLKNYDFIVISSYDILIYTWILNNFVEINYDLLQQNGLGKNGVAGQTAGRKKAIKQSIMDHHSVNRKDTNYATLQNLKQKHKKIKIIGMMKKNVASKEKFI